MIAGRSAKLLTIGLAAIGVGVLAAGLSLQAPAPSAPPPQAIAPRQPLVPSREAVRQAAGLSDAFIAIADAVTPAVVRIQAERSSMPQAGSWLPRGLQDFAEHQPITNNCGSVQRILASLLERSYLPGT